MILDELADYAKERVEKAKRNISIEEIKAKAASSVKGNFAFEHALRHPGLQLICEVKKASPSKGVISEDFPYIEIAKSYEAAGATCISCLTEPKWFLGSDEIFAAIRKEVSIPMIRKDFTVDEYQIYEAKLMGADAVLLICALLDTDTLRRYISICDELGISALVETHDESEIKSALEAGARMIGVNNRNLKDFTVDFSNAIHLRELLPENVIYVAESGISDVSQVKELAKIGVDAVLMGEILMKADNRQKLIEEMKLL